MRNVIGWFLAAALFVSLCSCGPRGPSRRTTYPVTGKVTVDGKAVAHLRVLANAKQAEDRNLPILPQADTKEDGSFELYSYEPGDGLPSGDYVLTFLWQDLKGFRYEGPDKLKNRYADPAKSTFPLTVEKGRVDLGTLELKTR